MAEEPGGLHGLADLVGPIVATYKWFQMVPDGYRSGIDSFSMVQYVSVNLGLSSLRI
jgi:hypothetical protein